jgi:hypothetical protein
MIFRTKPLCTASKLILSLQPNKDQTFAQRGGYEARSKNATMFFNERLVSSFPLYEKRKTIGDPLVRFCKAG